METGAVMNTKAAQSTSPLRARSHGLLSEVFTSYVLKGVTAVFSLAAIAFALALIPQHHLVSALRPATRGLAAAYMNYATSPSFVNVASIANTFQNPNTLLPMNTLFSQIQAQMQSGIPAGTPVWDGHGQLPGAVGTAGFNPSFHFDDSGCSTVPMTFYDVYQPSISLPTVWCGAVAQAQIKVAAAPAESLNGSGADSGPSQAPQVSVGRSVF
jgi:hypothetical protein